MKTYYIDLLINGSALYEFKTVDKIIGTHISQALNYLFLTNLNYGKVINFKTLKVTKEFVPAPIDLTERRKTEWHDFSNHNISSDGARMRKLRIQILNDLGAFLNPTLYTEVIIHFWGGEQKVKREVRLPDNGRTMGTQEMLLLNPEEAFEITTFHEELDLNFMHLQSLLRCTDLRRIYWVNLNHHQINFYVIEK